MISFVGIEVLARSSLSAIISNEFEPSSHTTHSSSQPCGKTCDSIDWSNCGRKVVALFFVGQKIDISIASAVYHHNALAMTDMVVVKMILDSAVYKYIKIKNRYERFVYNDAMHQWQDYVLAISYIVFNIALIPSIIGHDKPNLKTSIITATFQVPCFVVYLSLSLWFSAALAALNFSLWATLAIQKKTQLKK